MSTPAPLQAAQSQTQKAGNGALYLQRKCACGSSVSTLTGECEECSKKKRLGLQTKLTINEPGDIYEQEANRIADQVMAAPVRSTLSGAPPRIQRFSGQSNGQIGAAPASVIQTLANPGTQLEPALRQDMEQRFGHDFSRVRVHSGGAAEQSARDVNANAYTVGHNIVFGAGQFAPGAHEGRRLIAHELTHVVQQSCGGATVTSLDGSGPLEHAADRAATQAIGSSRTVVSGAAAPSLMCDPDDQHTRFDDEDEASSREKDKAKTQKRKQERATAGKQESHITQAEAERELRVLEKSYKESGAKSRSLKTKTKDLKRFEKLLERAGGTQLEKNKRKGAFDELQRTPSTTVGNPQTKHVAGGAQLPDQQLRAGKDPYAQPDYTIDRRLKDGSIERVHVNLKSDKIDTQTPAKARATARAYVEQAIRNSRHLADGESIIISFVRTPSKEVQGEMKREFFATKGSPISEVRFGTTTHRRKDYKPVVPKPAAPKTSGPKAPKAPGAPLKGAKTPKAAPPKVPGPKVALPKGTKAPKVLPASTPPKAQAASVSQKALVTPGGPKAAPPPAKASTTPTPPASAKTKAPATSAVTPKPTIPVLPVLPAGSKGGTAAKPALPTTTRGGMPRGGGGMRGMAAAEGIGALIEAIAVPIINHYLQEHYAESIANEARELIAKAIEERRPKFEAMIEAERAEIQKAQTEGRKVSIRVYVDTNWQDTDIGRVLTRAYVEDYQLTFEDGAAPKPHSIRRPGGWVGDLFRDAVGTSFSYETFDIELEGTDPAVAKKRLNRKLIETQLRSPVGRPPVEFEFLIVQAKQGIGSLDALREYAAEQRVIAGASQDAGAGPFLAAYWGKMEALIDGPLEDLVAAAKAKNISLDMLRAYANARRVEAGISSDARAGPAMAAYWSEVIRIIDAK